MVGSAREPRVGVIAAATIVAALAMVTSCRRDPVPGPTISPDGPAVDAPRIDGEVPAQDGGRVDGQALESGDAAAERTASAGGSPGTGNLAWIEAGLYKVRLGGIRACREVVNSTAGAGGSGAHAPTTPGRSWIGFRLEIASNSAKKKSLFVSPRDATLERSGIILPPRFLDLPKLKDCAPLMQPTNLKTGEVSEGFVVFELAPSFQAARGPVVLAYKPTRWGGAPRVALPIPDCLSACAPTAPNSKDNKGSRGGERRRRNSKAQ